MTQSEVEFFNRLAPEWDASEIRSTSERINAILDLLDIENGMNVLDLGTGTGVLIPFISERIGLKGRVVGVDLSEGMLEIACEKFGNLANVEFRKLDFEEQSIEGLFDIIMLYSVYPHLHCPHRTIERLFNSNIRSKSGKVVVAFPSDEKFINEIHHERKSESDLLPSAPVLAETIRSWGYSVEVAAYSNEAYVIVISRKD
ncbi:MAG: class I SAM-dependent methyltransferase [Muribaculaceae bacterium]|nr:class I SAM-dependent methyltransferase [Muribaculaceae bacterium]